MNNSNIDPCFGYVMMPDDNVSGVNDSLDAEKAVNDLNFSYLGNFDDSAAITFPHLQEENDMCAGLSFAPINTLNTPEYGDNNILSVFSDLEKAMPEKKQEDRLEHQIQSFNESYSSREVTLVNNKFVIQQTKHVKVDNNSIIIAKREEAIKIAVPSANTRYVKISVRNKAELHYNEPVQCCRIHQNKDNKPHPDATFYIPPKVSVKYEVRNGHHTALVMVLGQENSPGYYNFSVVFRCWTSCNKMQGKEQELILTAYDDDMGDELHKALYNLRICENVIRDSRMLGKDKVSRRRRSNNSLKAQCQPYPEVKRENETNGEYQDEEAASGLEAAAPLLKARFFKLEISDNLVPLLQEVVKLGGKLTEITGGTPGSLRSGR